MSGCIGGPTRQGHAENDADDRDEPNDAGDEADALIAIEACQPVLHLRSARALS